MEFFGETQKSFATYGIASKQKPFNVRNWLTIFMFILSVASNVLYFCFEAKTFSDYAKSILMTTAMLVAGTIFVFLILKMRKVFAFRSDVQQIIDDRKLVFNL